MGSMYLFEHQMHVHTCMYAEMFPIVAEAASISDYSWDGPYLSDL